MDQRGAGDLLGEDQSGHVRLVGADLAHHLLDRALRQARGETVPPGWVPEVNLGCEATIPAAYIPEAEVRLNLFTASRARRPHARWWRWPGRSTTASGRGRRSWTACSCSSAWAVACRALGVERLDGGPQGLALTFHDSAGRPGSIPDLDPSPGWREDRLVWPRRSETNSERLRGATELLRAFGKSR